MVRSPAHLIGDISSYQSLESFKKSLGNTYTIEEVANKQDGFKGDEDRPPFKHESLWIRGFSHLGHKGDLAVIFFNNRLAEVHFYPENYSQYLQTLSSKLVGKQISSDIGFIIRLNVRVWTATNSLGEDYVCWKDQRLADEMNRWIKRYS